MTNHKSFHAKAWIKPPSRVRHIAGNVILTPGGMIRPDSEVSRQTHGASVTNFMGRSGAANDSNLIAGGADTKAIFKIEKIHEEIGARQSDFLHDLPTHHTA